MFDESTLKDLLTQEGYSREEKALIALAAEPLAPRQVKHLRAVLTGSGVRAASKWNLSASLSKLGGFVARTSGGWELTTSGHHKLSELVGPHALTPAPRIAAALRHHLSALSNPDVKAYVEEAVRCFESKLYRAAAVLSWVGAVAVLHDHIVANRLADFNTEAKRRDGKWKNAKDSDGLGRMKEYDLLQTIAAVGLIGSNVKQELEKRLSFRNACGHPNSIKIGESMVAAHIEALILNVYSRF